MSRASTVWAPQAPRAVELRARRTPAAGCTNPTATAGGGWRNRSRAAGEADYGYLLDGEGTALPDPRSRRQPDGVHGLSRTFDPSALRVAGRRLDRPPAGGGVIYELHVGTFTAEGTLDAAAGKLDHLVGLGVDYVELLPVNAFNGTHNWGYDGVLWYAVHEATAARRLPAVRRRLPCPRPGRDPGRRLQPSRPERQLPAAVRAVPRAAARNTWGDAVNLDGPGSDEVRRYIIDNALMWLRDYHVDGLRLDAVHALGTTGPCTCWRSWPTRSTRCPPQLGRPLTLIAESDLNDPRLITPREAGGYGLTAQWSDDFHHALHVALTGETARLLRRLRLAGGAGQGADRRRSSTTARTRRSAAAHHGRPIDTAAMPTWRFVVCTPGPRPDRQPAAGDRLTAHARRRSSWPAPRC